MNYEKLDALVDSMKDELIEDIKRWIAVPSVQGPAAENAPFGLENRRMLDIALADARRYGFETRDFGGYAGDISFGEGAQTLGMLCHLDVVPAGDGWKHDPWGAEIEDGKIFGRGTMDDKGPGLCALYAMRAVRDAGIPLKDGVRLILGCDEETGMSDMRYYATQTKMPDYGFSPDAEFPVINTEKGGLNPLLSAYTGGEEGAELPVCEIQAGERPNVVPGTARAVVGVKAIGLDALRARVAKVAADKGFTLFVERGATEDCAVITAEGVNAHASMPHMGVNAAGMLLIALHELGAGGGSRPVIAAMAEKLGLMHDGEALGIKCEDELSGALTCNLGILRYDGRCMTAELDIRYPICTDEKTLCGQLVYALSGTGISVSRLSGRLPHHIPADHKIVRGLIQAYEQVTGQEGYAFSIGGGTYSRCMPNTVAFGLNFPDDTDTCHKPDEFIDIEKMMLGVRIFARAIALLAGGEVA